MAKAGEDRSLDGLASFASAVGAPDLTGDVAEAFDDPSTATLKATDDHKSESRKERKFDNRSSNKNHLKKLTSFNCAFTTAEQF